VTAGGSSQHLPCAVPFCVCPMPLSVNEPFLCARPITCVRKDTSLRIGGQGLLHVPCWALSQQCSLPFILRDDSVVTMATFSDQSLPRYLVQLRPLVVALRVFVLRQLLQSMCCIAREMHAPVVGCSKHQPGLRWAYQAAHSGCGVELIP
jgi:hypothetical protein